MYIHKIRVFDWFVRVDQRENNLIDIFYVVNNPHPSQIFYELEIVLTTK
jgi:hypothetical protein